MPMGFFSRISAPQPKPVSRRPDHCHVDIDGQPIRVALIWNERARRYSLRLRGAVREPVVTIPARGQLSEAKHFLDRHRGWLQARLAALPGALPLVDGCQIPFRGEPLTIRHVGGRGTARLSALEGETVLLVAGEPAHLPRRVVDFLKAEARRDLTVATARYASALGVKVKAIRLGDPTSRWGSCSSSGTIAYSWRLIMAPSFVVDYLAAHEVAHLREMNHSPRFWRHVRAICPEMDAAKSWLNRNGAALHAVGAQ